jgi:hypothetical protein
MNVDPRYFKYDGGDARMEGRPSNEVATYYANILYCENIRSVQGRYPDDSFDDLPGPCEKPEMLEVTRGECCEQYNDVRLAVSPTAILKMCACLDYQSCETDDWDTTLAYKLLQRIRLAAISLLPGYECAMRRGSTRSRISSAEKRREAQRPTRQGRAPLPANGLGH